MSVYAKTLQALQAAMLEEEPQRVMPILSKNRPALSKRLNVYIAGYRIRLVQAILSDYEALTKYLGAKETERLARKYIECTPSISYTLDAYPIKFAEYIAKHGNSDFAGSIAKLESAIAEVFWLPDSEAFIPPADLKPEQLIELCFLPRKAAKMIYLEYPVEEYMVAVRKGEDTKAAARNSHYMFIVRHGNEVKRYVLENTEQLILAELFTGKAVGVVLEEISEKHPDLLPEIEQKLQTWFARWIESGFFILSGEK